MSPVDLDGLIWATRGRAWGFRFLLSGGLPDPLAEYERHFAPLGTEATVFGSDEDRCAFRFPDPEGRKDVSGRLIPHEFVAQGALAAQILSAAEGLRLVWPLVAAPYAEVWDAPGPPSPADLRFCTP